MRARFVPGPTATAMQSFSLAKRKPNSYSRQMAPDQKTQPPVSPTFRDISDRTNARREASSIGVDELKQKLIPVEITDEDIKVLEQALACAQKHKPEDPASFVNNVNRLLETFSLRIRKPDGRLGKLRLLNDSLINISNGGQGGSGTFRKAGTLSVVRVPRGYHGNKHLSQSSGKRSKPDREPLLAQR